MSAPSTVLEGARLAHGGMIVDAPLALVDGRVARTGDPSAFRIDLTGHVVFPGLINAHDHLQLNGVRPLPHDAPFASSYEWIDAFAAHRRLVDVVAAVAVPKPARHWQGALKNLLAGATTVAHHDPHHPVLDDPTFPVVVPRGLGWAHSLGLGHPLGDAPPRYGPPLRESHAATPADRPWIVHLAEGTDAESRGECARLDALGCLTSNAVLVHGVGLTDADVERIVARGAAVVWCPASNLELLGRTIEARAVRRLFDAGRLALGTDSRLTGARDLLDELRVARAHSDLSPAELLRLVTTGAARVLRLGDRGTLRPGAVGDCVILRAGLDPYEALLCARRDTVRAVVRDGAPVLADPDFADWFAHCGVETARIVVDGRPKLVARTALPPDVLGLEPGLVLERQDDRSYSF
ncbi:amidohydrolase [Gemmatirosa kalamazoonensis]|uniref:Amidohydrolase n=1 Tax=Gemmatirosa kalamazoonensis TaxID=861299 RepID=W0RBA6_9BACT|nr:amidohydrolase family protein [Gemmatirosa kalamazoonensis]AHG88379.1 amidohydrolase [Gemmatirosa kalamazoonensis]